MSRLVYVRTAFLLCLMMVLPALGQAQDAAPSTAAAQPSVVRIPMRYNPPRILAPLVRVSINGGEPENFVLDTGAGYPLLVTTQYARRAKLSLLEGGVVANGSARLTVAEVKSVGMLDSNNGMQPLPLSHALVIDTGIGRFAPGEKVAGIIGINAFATMPFSMDFKAQRLTLYSSRDAFKLPDSAFTMTPLYLRSGDYEIDVTPSPGVQARLIVDTGAPICVIDQAVLTKLAKKSSATTLTQAVEGVYFVEYAVVKSFSIANTQQQNVYVTGAPPQLSPAGTLSVIGTQVLQNFRLLWDIPNKQLYWVSNPVARFNREFANSGASLILDGNKMRVRRVAKGSPAARAGLRVGDEVLRIDGIATSGEEVTSMEQVLDGVVGDQAVVEIKRVGVQTLRFRRTSAFSSSESPIPCFEGITGRVLTGKPLEVFSLKPNAPLFRAGVRAGDNITIINGKEVAKLSTGNFVELVRSPKVTIALRSKNGKTRTVTIPPTTLATRRRL